MELKKENTTVSLQEDGNLKIVQNEQIWSFEEGFRPYFEAKAENEDEVKTVYFEEAIKVSSKKIETGYGERILITYNGFPGFETFSFGIYAEMHKFDNVIQAGILPFEEENVILKKIVWPGAMEFAEICPEHYTVMPLMQGILIPNGWERDINLKERWELDPEYLYTRTAYMPWFGQMRGKNGYMMIVEDPFDAGFCVRHQAGGDTGIHVFWHSQLGKIGYRREVSYHFIEDGTYNTMCQKYRAYLEEKGEICTLKEKMIKNPKAAYLPGCAVYHDGIYSDIQKDSFFYDKVEKTENLVTFAEMGEKIEQIKASGIEKVFVHTDGWGRRGYDNQHPDVFPPCEAAGGIEGMQQLIETTHKSGYLFAIHDQYRDFYLDAPSYSQYQAKMDADGSFEECDWWNGGKQHMLCPEFYMGYVKRNYNELEKNGLFLDGSYLDVFSCIKLDECYNPEHPVTRKMCMEYRRACFDFLRSRGILTSSEEGVGWAARDLDIIHHAVYAMEVKDKFDVLFGKMGPESIGVPVPLFSLVYHDCVVVPWFVTEKDQETPNRESGFLHALLNGGTSYVSNRYNAEEIEKVKIVTGLHEKVACASMLTHEFLDKAGKRQKTVFANGIEVEVDFEKNLYWIKE